MMRKTTALFAAFGLLAAGVSPVIADEIPKGMQMPKPKPKARHAHHKPAPHAPTTAASHHHRRGMDHGGSQMHDKMMHDHNMGMQNGQMPMNGSTGTQGGQMPMPMGSDAPKPMKSGMGCC
jgi:hypothetical protein